LQRHLGGANALTAGTIRALLMAPAPVVLVGTLWPEWYTAYTARPDLGEQDPYRREREVLELAEVVRVNARFSSAELARAEDAAAEDDRIRAALTVSDYGLTQALAAAPQLVSRWEDANVYAKAVLTAAVDAVRLGAPPPLGAELLRAAAPGYCSPREKAEAPTNWFEAALGYATETLHGAAAALAPVGAGMGQTAAYAVADYLLQHATRQRRYEPTPAAAWEALIEHTHDAAHLARLAESADDRLPYSYAITLSLRAGDAYAGHRLG